MGDTGAFARCLSATLHIGSPSDGTAAPCCKGGVLQMHKCKVGNCTFWGNNYQMGDGSVLQPENLKRVAEVQYKPGRLVYFLAESLHSVTEVLEGSREILFMWFACTPTLNNG